VPVLNTRQLTTGIGEANWLKGFIGPKCFLESLETEKLAQNLRSRNMIQREQTSFAEARLGNGDGVSIFHDVNCGCCGKWRR
jgi:hypothetical protein